jgi:hypothetical protein
MAKLKIKEIQQLAKQIVCKSVGGIRYGELVKQIGDANPETPRNSVHGAVWDLDKTYAGEISKPSRGLFIAIKAMDINEATQAKKKSIEPSIKESEFYDSFAEWLKNDLDEATVAVALGGAGIKGKWGTPDVIGTFKPVPSNRVRFETEIISAEIKVNPSESITAFGQAAAYRLFSHKVYVVMPATLPEEDQSRLEALAMLFGVGFVIFDVSVNDPNYRVRVRAQRFSPDMFYVNDFADRLHDHNKSLFNKLFQ